MTAFEEDYMTSNRNGKVVLVTGASSGIGAAIAVRLAGAGHRVFGTSRKAGAAAPAPAVKMLVMDVRDGATIAAAIGTVMSECGRIDVLINNAGDGIAAAVEETLPSDLQVQLETNLFGPLRVCQAVLPHMRAQRSGRIVQITSLAARIAVPYQGAYSASKWALEGLSEAMSMELNPFGIDVVMIEPGDTKSNFTMERQWTKTAVESDVYRVRAKHAVGVMEKSEQAGPPAEKVARVVQHAVEARRPKLRYVSVSATERLALVLQRLLPGRVFEGIVLSAFKVPR
jgi:NAD(P)-dependent dehydrogenase (short-subunit alcohol dehydrogenase family)